MPVIEAAGLTKRFRSGRRRNARTVEAVAGIGFAVEPGERLAYIGPNGAGKSTSIKILTGILHPDEGTAEVLGLVPWRERRQLALRIGTLFGQRSQLWFELPPRESLALLGSIYRLDKKAAARRVEELGELLDAAPLDVGRGGVRGRCVHALRRRPAALPLGGGVDAGLARD